MTLALFLVSFNNNNIENNNRNNFETEQNNGGTDQSLISNASLAEGSQDIKNPFINLRTANIFNYVTDNVHTSWPMNGANPSDLDMTTSGYQNMSTAVYYKSGFDLDSNTNKGFSTNFKFIGYNDNAQSGEGLTFIISTENNKKGGSGNDLGYFDSDQLNSIGFYIDFNDASGTIKYGIGRGSNYSNRLEYTANYSRLADTGLQYEFFVWIKYDDINKNVIFEAYRDAERVNNIFKRVTTINIRDYIGNEGFYYPGFSASTGVNTSYVVINNWEFLNNNSNLPPLTIGSDVSLVATGPFDSNNVSYSFNGSSLNSFIDIPASEDFAFGTGDFTIEWFQFQTDNNSHPRIFYVGNHPTQYLGVTLEGGQFYFWNTGSNAIASITDYRERWVHWAIVRRTGTLTVYRNGSSINSRSFTTDFNNSTTKLTIGQENVRDQTNSSFGGQISNFRIVKGLGVYTGNFTKPTSNLTAVSSANPYGGSNTTAIPAGSTKLLLASGNNWSSTTDPFIGWLLPNGQTTFAIPSNGEIATFFYSHNNGNTWTRFHNEGLGTYIQDRIVHNGNVYSGYVYSPDWGTGNLNYIHKAVVNGVDYISPGNETVSRNNNIYYTPTSATITFNSNGGTAVNSITAAPNSSYTLPTSPTKNGYTFDNWFTDVQLTNVLNTNSFPSTNITVYAKWTPVTYAVTLNHNNGTNETNTVNAIFDSAMPTSSGGVSLVAPSRVGYTFTGYFDASSGGTQYYSSTMTSSRTWNKSSNFTLMARWTPISYAVTFNKNNGTGGSNSVNAPYESAMPSITIPTRTGLTFLGYFDSITGGNQYYTRTGTSFRTWNYTEARTLFARWALEGTTIFNTVGDSSWTAPVNVTSVEYLVVAGGGGGGNAYDQRGGGGGAAGMVLTGTLTTIPGTSYLVTVGAGGTGGLNQYSDSQGQNGQNSVFDIINAFGGLGGQASRTATSTPAAGGAAQIGDSVSAQPGSGGGPSSVLSGGGGGGATGSGSSGGGFGGAGGAGLTSNISGSTLTYGVGGAGGRWGFNTPGTNGTSNSGNGGGGAGSFSGGSASGGSGGSGTVIIKYSILIDENIITFDKQNGTGGTDSATAIYNSTMPSATAPTRAGYTFLGYFDAVTDGTQYYSNLMVSSRNWDQIQSTTLYARWQANNTVITFNGNGSTSGTMTTQSIATGSSDDLIANNFIRAGFVFTGWNTLADGTGTSFANLASYTAGTNPTDTLFAQWTANSNQITFNGNNATSGSMLAQGLNTGVTANLNANQFERTGYTFAGWNTLANGLGDNFANQASYTMGPNVSYELFAKWTANTYTITLDTQNGAGGDATRTATFDSAMPTPNNTAPTRTGFTFNGYFNQTNGNGTKYYNANMSSARNFDLTSNTTLFASWTADTFTITLNPSGGSGGDATRTATFGVALPTPNSNAPSRSGYAFSGYYSEPNGAGIIYYNNLMQSQRNFELTADTTLYAKWTAFIPLAKPTLNDASIFNFTDASSAYTLPVVSGNEIVLTTGGAQASAFFLKDKIVQTDGFSTYFEIKQYRTNNSTPADGLVFVLARDTNTIGASGGGLGYQGIPNSIGVGFDNYKNGSDPDPIFTTVYKDGVLGIWKGNQSIRYDDSFVSNYASAAVGSLVRTYKVSINYNKTERILYFKIDINGTDIYTYNFTEVDVPDEYFAGFTAGTGGASVKFAIPTWYFANSYYPDGIDPNTSNAVYVEDKTVPTAPTTINLTRTTGSNASFVLSGATDNNGVINYQYSFDGISWLDYSGDNLNIFDTETNRTLYARAFDGAGNLSPSINITTRFDLTFNSNLGSDVASVSEMANSSITRPADPTRSGYSFVNWHSDVELNNVFDFSSGISSNTIIYAKWQGLPYTVTFDKQLGTSGDNSAEVIFGSAMTSAVAPTRFGYNFAGYFSQANGQGTQYYNASMNSINNWNITENTTLFASWNAKTIAISFNNGTGASVTSAINATFAQPMPAATKPTLTGHDFMGYYTQASAQGIQYYDENMNSLLNWESETATTLFAHFTPSDYNITFNSNQGNNPSFNSKIVIYNQSFGELPTINRIGYDFAGWYDATTGGNLINEQTTVSIVQDTIYYARWTPMTFTITFNKDGGTGGSENATASYEQTLPVATIPNRSGYTFNGYYTEVNGAGIQYYSDNMSPIINYNLLSGVTLYAKWSANNYAFTFDPYGGVLVGSGSKVVTFNQAYGELPSATRVGHTFAGWYTTQVAGFEIIASEINTIFENKTFYARWTVNSYTINFITNGGNNINPLNVEFGTANSAISLPVATKNGGYEFVAWSPALPSTMPANELTLTAIYKRMIVGNDFSVTNINSNFKDGLIRFSLGVADSTARLFVDNEVNLSSPGSNVNAGVISRNGSDLYYGTGSSLVKFGVVDSTLNGNNGSDLLVNINSTVLFPNGNFNDNFSNWTTTNAKYNITGNSTSGMTYQSSIITESNGNKYARLYISGTTDSYGSVHGPYLTSSSFTAKPGDTISFKWKAQASGDDYDVYAFLENGAVKTQLLYSRGGSQASFQTREITLTSEMLPNGLTDNLKFIFVGGSYDRTGFRGIGATFYIDDVSIVDNGVTASVINNLIKNVKYSGSQATQFVNIETVDATLSTNYYSFNNEAPINQSSEDIINNLTSYSFLEDTNFSIKLDFKRYFTDTSNITYSIVDSNGLNSGFVSIVNDILVGNGGNSKVGNNIVYIRANNQTYQSSIIAYPISIINVNDPPTLNSANTNFKIQIPFNQAFSYQLPADFMIDIDAGTQLTYTITGTLPPGIIYNSSTRTFSGTFSGTTLPQTISITGYDGIESVVQTNVGFTSTVTVVFNVNGGSEVASQTIQTNQSVVMPDVPTKTGYSFGGWYSNIGLTTAYDFNSIPNGLNLYAKWNINPYTLTFDTNGGNAISSRTQNFATNIAAVADPVRPGFIFDRWLPEIPATVPAENITFVAQWLSDDYTFRFNQNYTNAPVIPDLVAQYLDDISTIRPANPIRAGYAFGGWFEDSQGTTPYQIPETMPVLGTTGAVKEVFAKWTPITYRINYLEMLTSIGSNPITYTIESNTITLQTNFSQTGFNFLGFYDNPAFSGAPITSIASGSIGDKNLYANWVKANFTLTFKDDKGGTLSTQSVQFGTTIDTSFFPSTEKPGFDFIGWGDSLPSVMPASNVEVIAQFKAKQFKLTIKDSTGNIITDEMLDFDSSLSGITLPEVEIEGFEFEGWEPALPAKMPAADLEIVGKYRELPKFKIIIYGTLDEVLAEFEFRELAEVSSVTLPDLSNSNNFVFEGWDGEVPSTMPGSNVEIRPIGTKRESALNIYSADRTLIDTIQAQVGSTLNIPIPSRLGFNFAGWTDSSGTAKNLTVMPEAEDSLFASWQAKIYSIQVTVGSNDFNINVTFGEPIGNIVSPQLFGFRFEGWKNNLTGEFLNSNTIFTTPEEINLVPVYTRLNAGETLIAATRLISDFILRLFR